MNVRTLQPLDAVLSYDDGETWTTRAQVIPAGTVVTGIAFENPDRSVGIFSGTAVGEVVVEGGQAALADFAGDTWEWWGEPATSPGDEPVPGWFEVIE